MTQRITLVKGRILSDSYFTLYDTIYDFTHKDGEVIRHKREMYGRSSGATVLLCNTKEKTMVLIHQFRVTTWVSGNESGQLIESCARLLGNNEPEVCIRREATEETGYEAGGVRKLFELYMSPGGMTELIHFFITKYSDNQHTNAGSDVEDEDTEALELPFSQTLEMIKTDEVRDGKTVLLLNYLQTLHLMG